MIPPLVSYSTLEQFLQDLEELSRRSRKKSQAFLIIDTDKARQEATLLWAEGMPPIVSRRAFSLLLGVSPRLIPRMMSAPEIYWRSFRVAKRSGGFRTIDSPRAFLKTVQLYILQNVLSKRCVSTNAFGFEAGRGSFANASQHKGKRYVLNVDLKDFFPSIDYSKVYLLFQSFGFSFEVAHAMASLCTLRGSLPQGAPTSPRIADLIFKPTDHLLDELAQANEMTYTRYADDLTFSSERRISTTILPKIVQAVDQLGFRLNHEKTRAAGPGMKKRVTGFVVNAEVHPERETRRKLRAQFHQLSTRTTIPVAGLATAQGWASYVNSYDRDLGKKYFEIVKTARQLKDLES